MAEEFDVFVVRFITDGKEYAGVRR